MAETLPSLEHALASADDLPSLPTVASEVLAICRSGDASLGDLAEALSKDPALSAKLMRFANSPLYNMGQEVTSLQRASLVLGLKTVQLIAVSFSLATSLPRQGGMPGFDYEGYWRRSLACAVAGRTLGVIVGSFTQDEAFLCGILSEIGRLVLSECMADTYAEVLQESQDGWPSLEEERKVMGFNSADVSAAVMEQWGMPELIRQGVRYARTPEDLPSDVGAEIKANTHILHLALLTVDLLTAERKGDALTMLEEKAEAYFQLTTETLYEYITSLEVGIRETSEMFSVSLAKEKPHESILQEAQEERIRISVGPTDGTPGKNQPDRGSQPDLTKLEPRCPHVGIPNGDAFDAQLAAELRLRLDGAEASPLGMLRIQFDAFHEVAGRDVEGAHTMLREAVEHLKPLVRRGDLMAYVGHGELAVLVRDGTPGNLRILAERLRRGTVKRHTLIDGAAAPITLTIAGASLARVSAHAEGRALKEATAILLRRLASRGTNRTFVQARPLENKRG